MQQSGLLNHLTAEDLVLADKGFLIQELVPDVVSVNIPPFLNNGEFTESEARATEAIAKCRIHVERENADIIFQLELQSREENTKKFPKPPPPPPAITFTSPCHSFDT